MPTPFIVISAIIAVMAVISFMRVKICIEYNNEFNIAVKLLFFTFRMKKQEKGQAKLAKKKKKDTQKFTYEQLRQFLDLFERFWQDAKTAFLKINKKVRIDNIKINMTIGGDDAAQIAITYGEACAVIFPVVSVLETHVKVKKRQISIEADFNSTAIKFNFDCRASFRFGRLLTTGIVSGIKIIVSLIKNPIHIGQRGVAK